MRCRTLLFLLTLAGAPAADPGLPPAELVERLGLSAHYRKHLDADGIPILASQKVADAALREAAHLIGRLLQHRPDIRDAIARSGVRLAIMAPDEMTTSVPEHSDLKPARYWDRRARGLGATRVRPAVSCGEENLLCYSGDPYAAENILIHEFAHVIHQIGLAEVEPDFDERLTRAYEEAVAAGLWEGTYAATNRHEYWAEGIQSWFDTNRENDSVHNEINTREELRGYDPGLAALIERTLGEIPWRYRRPADRPEDERAHLAGHDPAAAPVFSWPEHLRGPLPEPGSE